MAVSSVILDIRANTQRALSDFKAFSAQLDNKFLVSGLKLDVVRSALSQINREFQRNLGEEGLSSARSLQAAQNQVASLASIYAGFSKSASTRLVDDFSDALNQVAVKIGSTAKDVQGSLRLAPWLSRDLPESVREGILVDVQKLQTYASQGGIGDNAASILNEFMTGQVGGDELESRDDPLSKIIGSQLRLAGVATSSTAAAMPIAEKTRVLREILTNLDLEALAKETGGFKRVLAQFSASLFNPKAGLLGSMKEFTLKTGEAPTTLFKETTALFESIFGPEGFIKTLSRELAKAFGLREEDGALKFLGRGIRFLTRMINGLKDLIDDVLNDPLVKDIIRISKEAFNSLVGIFRKISEVAKEWKSSNSLNAITPDSIVEGVSGFFGSIKEAISKFLIENEQKIISGIKQAGEFIRELITGFGKKLRGEDIEKETSVIASIAGTISVELAKTLGVIIKEAFNTIVDKGPSIASALIGVISRGLTNLFSELFGEGAGGVIGLLLTGGIIAAIGKKLVLGVVAFGAKLIGALPGGAMINKAVGDKIKAAVNVLGASISKSITSIGTKRTPIVPEPEITKEQIIARRKIGALQHNSVRAPVVTRGAESVFQKKVLAYLNSITRCICGPGGAGGADGKNKPPRRQAATSTPLPPSSPLPPPKPKSRFSPRMVAGTGTAAGLGIMAAGSAMSGMEGGIGAVAGGVATGASIGMLFGPQGAIAGAILGGIGGWLTTLKDSGDKTESVLRPLNNAFKQVTDSIGPTFGGLWESIKSIIFSVGNLIKVFSVFDTKTNDTQKSIIALKVILWPVVGAFQLLEQVANVLVVAFKGLEVGTLMVRKFFSSLNPIKDPEKEEELNRDLYRARGELDMATKLFGKSNARHMEYYKTPPSSTKEGNYEGLNYYGPLMSKEASMSGGRPLLVNDREFVIPRDGFNVMADLLSKKGRGDSVVNQSVTYDITINATGLAGEDIARSIKEPVLKIIDDQNKKTMGAMVLRGSTVS